MSDDHLYRGARAMVHLHEVSLREFTAVWKRAKAEELVLPPLEDPSYASLDTLLHHVLRAARGYMVWMCEKLELAPPGIDEPPPVEDVTERLDAYIDHLLAGWREPLRNVPAEKFERGTFESWWGVHYCVDAMLEHAVMHPVRHSFQLEEWLQAAVSVGSGGDL